MLSPHEFAALMVIDRAHDAEWTNLSSDTLATLVERQLVYLKQHDAGRAAPVLTDGGRLLLRALLTSSSNSA